jgi:4-carboxymuconolactone decarboxylase
MRQVPARFLKFKKDYPEIAEAYEKLASECHTAGPLNERDRALVKLGVATGSGVEGSVRSQVRKALDLGISPDEIRHTIVLSLTAIGFPKMMAILNWAEVILREVPTRASSKKDPSKSAHKSNQEKK